MHGYTEPTTMVLYHHLRARLAELPLVEEAAVSSWFPLGFEGRPSLGVDVDGYARAPSEDVSIPYRIVSPCYFAARRIPILDGRDFQDQDDTNAPPVAIINETMAMRFWSGRNPIGRKFRIRGGNRELTVVGVAKAGKYRSLDEPPRSFFYLPFRQAVWDLNLGVALRTAGEPRASAASLRRTLREVDPAVDVWALLPMSDYLQAAFLEQGIAATLLIALGLVALALAAIGIYGVMAYVVSHRRHEIGIRMALGAQHANVVRLVVGQGMVLASIGIGVGLVGGPAGSRALSAFLHGVSPFDPVTFLGVTVVLGVVALLACYCPAGRATQVHPMVALRAE